MPDEHDQLDAPLPPLDIVVLDDDPDFREYALATLNDEGHRVRAAASPDELFAMLEQRMADAVLLDIKMGRHAGEDVLAELRERWRKLCVIIITGYPSMDSMRQTFKQDVFDYIRKPFSIDELRAVLAQAAAEYGLGASPQDRLRAELGRQVRLARTEKRWTLRELSEASGVSVSQLSSIERGAHLPSLESMVAVAGALGAKPSEWMRGAGF